MVLGISINIIQKSLACQPEV